MPSESTTVVITGETTRVIIGPVSGPPGPAGPAGSGAADDAALVSVAAMAVLDNLSLPHGDQREVNESVAAVLNMVFGAFGGIYENVGFLDSRATDLEAADVTIAAQASTDRATAAAAVEAEESARLAEAADDRAASVARDGVERTARLAQGRPPRTRWALVGGNFDDRGLYRLPFAAVGPIAGGGFDLRAEAVAVSGPVGSDGEFLTQSHDGEFGDWDNFELWLRHELFGCRFEAEWTQQGGSDERASLTSSRLFRYGEVPPVVRFTLDFATGRATFWFETFDQAAADATTADGRLWGRDTFITVGATDIDPTCTADWLVGFGNGPDQRRLAGRIEARNGIDGPLSFTFDPDLATDDATIPDPVSGGTWSSIDDTRLVDTSPRAAALAATDLAELTARVAALENP